MEKKRFLIADDDEAILSLYASYLRHLNHHVDTIPDLQSLERTVTNIHYDVVILDLFFGDEISLPYLKVVVENSPLTAVIILSAHDDVPRVIDALKLGASTYLLKTESPKITVQKICETIEEWEQGSATPDHDHGIVGTSKLMEDIRCRIESIAKFDSTVLVTGESGTGKELVVRAIHATSSRKDGQFSALNCGAIPENLLESELFGHRKGSFTDAKRDRKGLFEISSAGTLFLDEVGELPLSLQVKLLRAIQEKEIMPIGASSSLRVNTRIIAATNANLLEEVARKTFRNDLYFRLNVINIHLPPLRSRKEDIAPLLHHFLKKIAVKYHIATPRISSEVIPRMLHYSWPGNVRELENSVERALIFSKKEVLEVSDFFSPSMDKEKNVKYTLLNDQISEFVHAKSEFEKEYLIGLLDISRGNIAEASRLSGQYRANLYRLLRKHHIDIVNYK